MSIPISHRYSDEFWEAMDGNPYDLSASETDESALDPVDDDSEPEEDDS